MALRNRPAVRPFEIFTRVLPLPRYGTIDPTPLVAFFFPLFYGIIIGDIGYGLLLLAIALFARRRYGSNPLVADARPIFAIAALSAVAWGFAYGELFGDLGARAGFEPLFIDRMKDFSNTMALRPGHRGVPRPPGHRARRRHRDPARAPGRGGRQGGRSRPAGRLAAAILAGRRVPSRARRPRWGGGDSRRVPADPVPVGRSGSGDGAPQPDERLLRTCGSWGSASRRWPLPTRPTGSSSRRGRRWWGSSAAVVLHAVNLAFGVLSPTVQSMRLHYVEFFENFFVGGGRAYKPFKSIA